MSKLLFALSIIIFTSGGDLELCRSLYFDSGDDSNIERYYDQTRSMTSNDPTIAGYKAVAKASYAQVVFNPISKWSYFNDGRDELEALIKTHSNNVELRFLRYSIQANVPGMVDYTDNLEEDIRKIEQYLYNELDYTAQFWKRAIEVMAQSENLPDGHSARIAKMKKHISE